MPGISARAGLIRRLLMLGFLLGACVCQAATFTGLVYPLHDVTLTLAGTNSYAGPTTIATGTLTLNGRHNGPGLFTVNSGAMLGGAGVIASAVAVLDARVPRDSMHRSPR